MYLLLTLSRGIDALNEVVGRAIKWLILVAVVISAANAVFRYTLDMSSNAWLEAQWYLFSAVFLLVAGYTHLRNEHIRIDIISGRFSKRAQAWLDIVGTVFFLLPMAVLIMVLSWPMVHNSFVIQEVSANAGGLLRWPVKVLLPLGFLLLVAQALSELIKRIAFLTGHLDELPGQHGGHHGKADEAPPITALDDIPSKP